MEGWGGLKGKIEESNIQALSLSQKACSSGMTIAEKTGVLRHHRV